MNLLSPLDYKHLKSNHHVLFIFVTSESKNIRDCSKHIKVLLMIVWRLCTSNWYLFSIFDIFARVLQLI